MSSGNTIDSRVVELSLENQKFESNANTSISTLDRLKKALNFSGSSKNFEEMNNSIGKVNVGALSAGVNTLKDSLAALGRVAVFSMIADEAIKAKNAVEGFVKSVTIDQVSAGFDKYAEKTSAVQTIMSATANAYSNTEEQMADVNAQLEKLNWFTDETSFNFVDMVSNIGKFTSNNVGLEESVTAMQGISTWAAKSGAGVNEASRAMYNLSQAMAMGSVRVTDWMSIENANMATAEFKQTAIEAAAAIGTLKETSDGYVETISGKAHKVSVENFRSTLQDGWLTSQVLMDTLDNYGAFTNALYETMDKVNDSMTTSQMLEYIDQFKDGTIDLKEASEETGLTVTELKKELETLGSSEMEFGRKAFAAAQEAKTLDEAIDSVKDAVSTGWMNTFEIMFGDYLQAKELWTELANDLYEIFAEGGNARNELLKEAFSHQTAINDSDWALLQKSGLASDEYINAVKENAAKHGVYLDQIADKEAWISNALRNGLLTVEDLNEAYQTTFGNANVNQEMLERLKTAKESDETFQGLLETVQKFSEEDLSSVVFGDGQYTEGLEELEQTLDSMVEHFGLSQEEGKELVSTLIAMENGGKNVSNTFAKVSDEELKALNLTDEEIQKLRQAQEEGKLTADMIMDVVSGHHMSGQELWIESLRNGMAILINLIDAVKEAFHDIFPETESSTIFSFLEGLYNFTSRIREATETAEPFKAVLRGIFAAADLVLRVLRGIGSIAVDTFKTILEAFGIDIGQIAENAGNAVTKFREWVLENEFIEKAIAKVTAGIHAAIYTIRDFGSVIAKHLGPGAKRTFSNFKEGFSTAFKNLGPFFKGLGPQIQSFIDKVKALGGINLGNLKDVFGAFKSEILDYIANFEGFSSLKNAFSQLGSDLHGIFDSIGTYITDSLNNWRANLDDNSLAAKIYDYIMGAIEKVKSMLAGAADFGESAGTGGSIFSKIFATIVNAITGIADFLKNVDWGLLGGIAFAITPIMLVISIIRKIHGLLSSFSDIMDNISEITGSLSKKMKPSKLDQVVDLIKSIAILFVSIAGSLFVISKIPADRLDDAIFTLMGIVVIMAVFVGAIAAINDLSDRSLNAGAAATIVASAAAIFLVTSSLIKLSKAAGKGADLEGAFVVLAGLALLLVTMQAVMGVIGKFGGTVSAGQVAGLIASVVAIKMLVNVLIKLSKADPAALKTAERSLFVLVGVIAAIQIVLAVANKIGGSSFRQSASMIASVLAIYILAKTLMKLAKADPAALKRAMDTLIALAAIIAVLQMVIALCNSNGGASIGQSVAMVASVASIYILAKTLMKLAKQDPTALQSVLDIMLILAGILAGMEMVLAMSSRMGKVSAGQIVSLIAIAASIYILSLAFVKLSTIPVGAIAAAEEAILMIGLVLAGVMLVVAWGSKLGGIGVGQIIGMVAIAAAIYIMSMAFAKLAEIQPGALETAQSSIITIAGVLMALMVVGSLVSGASVSLLVLAVLIGVMGLVMYKLSELPVENVQAVSDGLMKAFLGLSVFIGVIALAGNAALAAMPAVVGILAILGIVTIVFGVVSGLVGLLPEAAMNTVLKGADFLIQLGHKLGEFVASIVVGFGGEALTLLPQIATALKGFMDNIQGIPTVDLAGLAGITEALAIITGISFVEAFASLGDLVTEMTTGKTSIELFSDNLKFLAEGLSSWEESMGTINEITIPVEGIDKLMNIVDKLSLQGMFDAIETRIAEWVSGKSSMDTFTDNLADLAEALKSWQTNMEDIGTITVPEEAITSLIESLEKIPGTGLFDAIDNFFTGAPDLNAFKENLTALGDGMKNFSTTLGSDFDASSIATVADACTSLANIGNALKGQQLKDTWLGGEGILKQFAKAIIDFAEELKGLADVEIDIAQLSGFADAASALSTAVSTFSQIDISSGQISDAGLIEQFKTGLQSIKEAIEGLADMNTAGVSKLKGAVSAIGQTDLSSAVTQLNNAKSLNESKAQMSSSGSEMGSALVSGLNSQSDAVSGALTSLISNARSAINVGEFGTVGTELINALSSAVSASGSLSDAMRSVCSAAASSASGYSGHFAGVGRQLVAGFANGISSAQFMAMASARAMALAALNAAKAAIDSHSPSREAYKVGNFFGLGFTNAIDDNVSNAYDSGYAMADSARKGLARAASLVNDILASDMDVQPVISPVLDLSNIEEGASNIGNMLNMQPIAVTGNIGAITSNVNARSMTSNADVVKAIAALRNSLGASVGGDTYNINGITYDDGSNVSNAVRDLIRETRVRRKAGMNG